MGVMTVLRSGDRRAGIQASIRTRFIQSTSAM